MQSDSSLLPVTATNFPTLQSMQSLRALPPAVSRYVPASQLMHHAAPVAGAYIPVLQAMQSEAASLPVVSRCLPTGHRMHWSLATPRNLPEAQNPHTAAPAGAYRPGSHWPQSSDWSLPASATNRPMGHEVQLAVPSADANFPGTQDVQFDPCDPPELDSWLPTAQAIQSLAFVDPVASLYFPARQSMQLELAFTLANCPALQLTQAEDPATDANRPATQSMQSSTASLPSVAKYFPASHAMQSDMVSLAGIATYRPAGQDMHVVLPVASAYVPAPHSAHTEGEELPVDAANLPATHSIQSASSSLPTVGTYVPAAQSMQRLAPVRLL